jgi:hypothetical protein
MTRLAPIYRIDALEECVLDAGLPGHWRGTVRVRV